MKRILIISFLLFGLGFAYAYAETEKYECTEVKTEIVDDKIQIRIIKENTAEFELKDNCVPENLKVKVKDKIIIYQGNRRLVEDGRIEKNDLFAVECYEPFLEGENVYDYQSIQAKFYKGKISPLITPDYPLYPTLKQTAEKVNLDAPQRTFIIFGGFGGALHEFFCYIDEKSSKKPSNDICKYSFDEVIDIHAKNKDTSALKGVGDKYLKRFEYEKAEKAYRKIAEITSWEEYDSILNFYITTKNLNKAKEILLKKISQSPYDTSLYPALAKVYLYDRQYDKAEALIQKSLNLRYESGLYEAYGILGEIYLAKREFQDAIVSFKKASGLLKKECEDDRDFMQLFFRQKDGIDFDCETQPLPYYLKIIQSLTELGDFKKAEDMAKELLRKIQNDPYLYGHLSYVYAAKGEFDIAIEMADKAISLLKRKGIGANIVEGEIYPMVVSIDKNTPAERAGLKKGDKIINIGDKDLRLLRETGDITKLLVDYIRNNEKVILKIHSKNSVELRDIEIKPEEFLKPEASNALAFRFLLLRIKGKLDEADNSSLKAYELNPEDSLSVISLALVKSDRGKHNEAIPLVEKLRIDETSSLVLLIKPIIYAKAGKLDRARELQKEIPKDLVNTKNALHKKLLDEIKMVLK